MIYVPLNACCPFKVTNLRTRQNFTKVLKYLADIHFPEKIIVLAVDNLNTHKLSTLYDTLELAES